MHTLTCSLRRRWLRWRIGMPFWRDDTTAQMLGVAQYGCHRCGRGATKERDAAHLLPSPTASLKRGERL